MSGPPPSNTHVLLSEYEKAIAPTDRFDESEITPILLGLFGEVGSVMSTSKKLHREKTAFTGFQRDVEEELGDTLWYVAALCRRLGAMSIDGRAELVEIARHPPATSATLATKAPAAGTVSQMLRMSQASVPEMTPADLARDLYEERAAIREFDGGQIRETAERAAWA